MVKSVWRMTRHNILKTSGDSKPRYEGQTSNEIIKRRLPNTACVCVGCLIMILISELVPYSVAFSTISRLGNGPSRIRTEKRPRRVSGTDRGDTDHDNDSRVKAVDV